MDKTQALQKLLNGTATKKEIELLKQALASGEISIGGDVNRSVVIIGSGNKVELTAEALGILKPEAISEEPVEGEPPYMGMRYFDTADAGLFYGREALTRELVARVAKENFLAIVGASGSGKSSVARAGLVPAWNAGIVESGKRVTGAVYILTPTMHPLENLAASLTRESESITATSTLMDDLKNDSRSLRLYIRKLLSQSGGTNLLLVVDQFEETFTLCKDAAERTAFIENLLEAASEDDGAARVVLTLRADFYHHCFEYEGLRLALEKHQANIGAMTPDELREAITAPAQAAGWDFQPGLVSLILEDVGSEPGALPLLSHALLETWKRRQGCMMTLTGYTDAGGVKKAIAQTAENVYDHLSLEEQAITCDIFLRLTRLDTGNEGRDIRKRVTMSDLFPLVGETALIILLLDKLANTRLIVKTLREDKIEIEVAHEALIYHWERLRAWLNEDRDNIKLRESVSDAAKEWNENKRDESLLVHRGGRLEDLEALSQQPRYKLNAMEAVYFNSCIALRNREALERREMQKIFDQLSRESEKANTWAAAEEINQSRQFKLANEIVKAVGASLDLETTIYAILSKLHEAFGKTRLCVLLYDKHLQALKFAPGTSKFYKVNNPKYIGQDTFPLEKVTIACRVARKTLSKKKVQSENVDDVSGDAEYLILDPKVKSEFCISLLSTKNELLGVMALERKKVNGFGDDDIEVIKAVAQHISIAIERAQQSEDLEYNSTVAAQTSWAANLAHEVNNEVGKILNWAYFIRKIASGNPEIHGYARNIEESATKLSSTNPWTGKPPAVVEIDVILKSYLEQITLLRSIEVKYDLCAPEAKVLIKTVQFQHVLRQLVNNASRAMDALDEKKVLVSTRLKNNSMVEILFEDFGPGLSEEKHLFAFRRRFTTKETGGYGLLFIRQMIEDMLGEIVLRPYQTGKGAAFLIRFPVAP